MILSVSFREFSTMFNVSYTPALSQSNFSKDYYRYITLENKVPLRSISNHPIVLRMCTISTVCKQSIAFSPAAKREPCFIIHQSRHDFIRPKFAFIYPSEITTHFSLSRGSAIRRTVLVQVKGKISHRPPKDIMPHCKETRSARFLGLRFLHLICKIA